MSEMLNRVSARLGPDAQYGLGVIIRPTKFGVSYGRRGFFPGYSTEMKYSPDRNGIRELRSGIQAPAFEVNTAFLHWSKQ